MLRRHRAALALVVWTFFVWTTRIGNIWRDDDLDTAGKWGRTALAASFTVLAVAVVVALWRRSGPARLAVVVGALAAWTTAVWLVRGTGIVLGDHEVGFKVVHTVLAVVSIILSALAWRETRPARSAWSAAAGHTQPAAGVKETAGRSG
jgi:hypothetical protein